MVARSATDRVETPEEVLGVIEEALKYADAERIQPCTNCGLAPRSRAIAEAKLIALGAGARLAREKLR